MTWKFCAHCARLWDHLSLPLPPAPHPSPSQKNWCVTFVTGWNQQCENVHSCTYAVLLIMPCSIHYTWFFRHENNLNCKSLENKDTKLNFGSCIEIKTHIIWITMVILCIIMQLAEDIGQKNIWLDIFKKIFHQTEHCMAKYVKFHLWIVKSRYIAFRDWDNINRSIHQFNTTYHISYPIASWCHTYSNILCMMFIIHSHTIICSFSSVRW